MSCENIFAKAAMVICVGKCITQATVIPATSDQTRLACVRGFSYDLNPKKIHSPCTGCNACVVFCG